MKLKEFEEYDHRRKEPSIRFYRNTGSFLFTKSAGEILSLKDGDRVRFFQNEENPSEWFFNINRIDGFRLNMYDEEEFTYRFHKKSLISQLIETMGIPDDANSFSFSDSIELNGITVYKITVKEKEKKNKKRH